MKLLDCILDYQERFNGKTCQVSTNYKYLEIFKVNFCLTDLHHLFDLYKITRDYASQTKPAIQAGVFILEDFRNIRLFVNCSGLKSAKLEKGQILSFLF